MGKTNLQGPKDAIKKPVTKKISKLQRLKKINSNSKKLKKRDQEPIEEPQEDNNTYDIPEEQINDEVDDEQNDEMVDVQENGTNQQEEEVMEAEANEKHDEEDDTEDKVRPATNLVRVMNPILESGPIYTGGKIELSTPDNDLFCLCSNEIVVYSLESKSVKKRIKQVKLWMKEVLVYRKMKKLVTLSYIHPISPSYISQRISL